MRISDWSSDVCSSDLKGHDLDRVGWLPPECLAKVVEDVATLFDPPAEVLPATSQDDAADGSWMIGAVDDSVFGQLAACPDIGERRDIAVEHARASEDQKDRRREVLPLLDADVRCLLQARKSKRVGKECVSTCRSRGSPFH